MFPLFIVIKKCCYLRINITFGCYILFVMIYYKKGGNNYVFNNLP
nr:MAG TPA: hypothetical protein [Caudoviricetes sp.]